MDADLTIMGGGIAGLTAAMRGVQLGMTVMVLEQGTAESYPCNSRFSGGVLHVCYKDPTSASDVLRRAIERATGGTARPGLADAMAHNAGRIIDWLRAQGATFVKGGSEEYKRWVLAPIRPQRRGLFWNGLGADVVLRSLEKKLVAGGGSIQRDQKVIDLKPAENGWVVHTAKGHAYRSAAIVIADGGFQGSAELVRRHISPRPEHVLQRGAGTGMGDGLRLAMELGAGTGGLDRIYGHVMHADALQREDLWPYPWMDGIASAAIVVDRAGRRFVDEGKGGVFIANAIARQPEPLQTWAIFDAAVWRGPGARGVIPPNPNMALAGIVFPEAGTVPELAKQLDVDPDILTRTVEDYNEAIRTGELSNLSPPRAEGTTQAMPVVEPPFRAAQLVAGMTYTMGGISIDGDARVLRPDSSPIEGLYAAGAATGGLEGGPDSGYVGGLMKSVLTGLLAAEHAASLSSAVSRH